MKAVGPKNFLIAVTAAVALVGSSFTTASGSAPAKFQARIDNPYFPLHPHTTYTYRGAKDGKPSLDRVAVTGRIVVIAGARCRAVKDELFIAGRLRETTIDWYSQDQRGNVWYYGENTKELDRRGHVVSTEGTWKAGVDGARPGIFMPQRPKVGQSFQQEYYPGHAEDHFQILSVKSPVQVPYGSFKRALETKEWTPLEPDVLDHKYYVRGIGLVRELTLKGPREASKLVSVARPGA
jgi:hypothetical protein